MQNEDKDQDVRWMSPASRELPHPQTTSEFPSGLITDYIKMVDLMRNLPRKDK